MFSDHLKKPDEISHKAMFGIAASLVFACQVIAMVVIVEGQVEKAHDRNARHSLTRVATADCSRNYLGAARSRCIAQVDAGSHPSSGFGAAPEARTLSQVVENTDSSAYEEQVVDLMKATLASH